MMRQLMHQHMRHQLAQGHIPPIRPFIKDGPPEQPDRVGAHRLIHHRFLGQRDAVIKPRHLEGVVHLHLGQQVVGREILDPYGDAARGLGIRGGDLGKRGLGQRLEGIEAGGDQIVMGRCVCHGPDMDNSAPI